MVSQEKTLDAGEIYFSTQLGEYVLLGREGTDLKVRFANGTEDTIDAEVNERIVRDFTDELNNYGYTSFNEERRRKFVRAIGFLAKVGDLHVTLLPGAAAKFRDRYQKLTGQVLTAETAGYTVLQSDSSSWGSELSIDWTATLFQMNQIHFGQNIQMRRRGGPGEYRITNSMFFYKLLEWGFVLGPKQDANRIRTRIPELVATEFDKGLRI